MFTIFIWFWHSNSVIGPWHITILMKCWMNAGEVSLILCWLPSCYCDTRWMWSPRSREWSLKPQIWCRTAIVLLLQIMQSVLTEFQPFFLCVGRFEAKLEIWKSCWLEFLHNWILTRTAESTFGVLSLLTMILGLDIWLIFFY